MGVLKRRFEFAGMVTAPLIAMWIVALGVLLWVFKKGQGLFRINASARRCFMVLVIYSSILYQRFRCIIYTRLDKIIQPECVIAVIWANLSSLQSALGLWIYASFKKN